MPDITTAQEPISFEAARGLFREYAGELGVDLCFQGFSSELENLETMYAAPAGWLGMLRHGRSRRLRRRSDDSPRANAR